MSRSARRTVGWLVRGFVFVALSQLPSHVFADHPIAFPWGHAANSTPRPTAPYRILSPATAHHQPAVPVQTAAPKAGYAYGWFGSNPHPQFTRHLGYHQNVTQWKLTP